uniref:Uncharacterized protein n=1 Tax=Candida parapsilosis (strain CDC 317 / ATCC MYA-4646) TaxID=578454 RepID=A0AAJ8VTU7_CANPC
MTPSIYQFEIGI